jgi:YVTN family beta-propeller protein
MRTLFLALALVAATVGLARAATGSFAVAAAVPVGKHPAGVAVSGGMLWVTNDVDNTVSRIDLTTDRVTATVPLGGKGYPDPALTATSEGTLWVAAPSTGTISRIDTQTGKVTATLTVPTRVDGVSVVGDSVWITSFDPYRCSSNRCFSRLTRISTLSASVTGKFSIGSPVGITFGFGSLWIVNHREMTVTRFNPATGKVVKKLSVRIRNAGTFEGPEQVAAGLGSVWVSQPAQNIVTRIDPRSDRITARIKFPRSATPFTFAIGARSLWVLGPKSIFRVDPRTNRIADSARIGKHAGSDYRGLRSIAVVDHSLWVTDGDADTVDRIDIDQTLGSRR